MSNITTEVKQPLQYLASFSERAPAYLFPVLLMFIEWVLRFAFKLNTQEFVGPTLAATGVGMAISLTSHQSRKALKNVPPELQQFILANNLKVETNTSRVFRNVCWIATIFLTALWIASMILSTQALSLIYGSLPVHYYPGLISYLIGFVLSEVKEAI